MHWGAGAHAVPVLHRGARPHPCRMEQSRRVPHSLHGLSGPLGEMGTHRGQPVPPAQLCGADMSRELCAVGCPVPGGPQRSLCSPGLGGLFLTQGMKISCSRCFRSTNISWATAVGQAGKTAGAWGGPSSEACPLRLAKRSLRLVSPPRVLGTPLQQQEGLGRAPRGPSQPPNNAVSTQTSLEAGSLPGVLEPLVTGLMLGLPGNVQ